MGTAKPSSKPTGGPWKPSDTIAMPDPRDGEKFEFGTFIDPTQATDLELLGAAYRNDDKEAGEELKRRYPGDTELIRFGGGDLGWDLRCSTIRNMFKKSELRRDSLEAKLKQMQDELEGPRPSFLEKLLVDRICATWLDLHHRELLLVSTADLSLAVVQHRDRMRDRAHRRHLQAVKALAQLRKLALPTVTVITSEGGPQQVNLEPAAPPQSLKQASEQASGSHLKQVGAQVETEP
jgi:hypothetical protein